MTTNLEDHIHMFRWKYNTLEEKRYSFVKYLLKHTLCDKHNISTMFNPFINLNFVCIFQNAREWIKFVIGFHFSAQQVTNTSLSQSEIIRVVKYINNGKTKGNHWKMMLILKGCKSQDEKKQ